MVLLGRKPLCEAISKSPLYVYPPQKSPIFYLGRRSQNLRQADGWQAPQACFESKYVVCIPCAIKTEGVGFSELYLGVMRDDNMKRHIIAAVVDTYSSSGYILYRPSLAN